jgi:serine/threonine protein kinase
VDDDYRNEVSIMMRVADHGNIVRLLGYCNHIVLSLVEVDGKMLTAESHENLICMEYVRNGTLGRRISGKFDNTECPGIKFFT